MHCDSVSHWNQHLWFEFAKGGTFHSPIFPIAKQTVWTAFECVLPETLARSTGAQVWIYLLWQKQNETYSGKTNVQRTGE